MRANEVERFNNEMELRSFWQKFKSQIEDGLTLARFKQQYSVTSADVNMFEAVSREVEKERTFDKAFKKDFTGRLG